MMPSFSPFGLPIHLGSIPMGSIDSNDVRALALRAPLQSRFIPIGSIDSTASRILGLRSPGHFTASPHFDSFASAHSGIRPAYSAALGPVRNWSSLFLNRMLNVVSDP